MPLQAIPSAGDPLIIVGHVHAFPRHPAPGTVVSPLAGADTVAGAEHAPGRAYALVSVEWATTYTTLDLGTGSSETQYRRGEFGLPTEWTWYLAPAVLDEDGGQYRLTNDQVACGHRTARLPELVGLNAPAVVAIHDVVL